jgi:autotransporter-associated beta strand protein
LNLGTITYGGGSSRGGSLWISADSIVTTNLSNSATSGIMGGNFVVGKNWAVSAASASNTPVTGLTSYTPLPLSTATTSSTNYSLTGGQNVGQAADLLVGSMKIIASDNDQTLALGARSLTPFTVNNASGLIYDGGSSTQYTYNITGNAGVAVKSSNANSDMFYFVYDGALNMSVNPTAGSGGLVKVGNGTLILNASWTGSSGIANVNEGTIRLMHANAFGQSTSGIKVQNGATMEVGSNISLNANPASIVGTGVSGNGALRNLTGITASYAGAITIGTGGARINSDSTGALTLTGGVVTSLFNNVTFGGAGNITVQTAAISGAGGLIKDGAGTTNLSTTNTYTGVTRVSNGILSVGTLATPTGSINSSALTINGGNFRNNSATNYTGALTFTSGTISGTNWGGSLSNLTIGTGQIISPGNSPGTATVTGDQTWASAGSYTWEINSTSGTAGADPGWDLINGSGTLSVTALAELGFNINVTSLTTGNASGLVSDFDQSLSYNWLIADFAAVSGFSSDKFTVNTSSFSNAFTGNFGVALGNSGTIGGDNTQVWLTYTAIPEPKTALLGVLGVLLLLRRRREK